MTDVERRACQWIVGRDTGNSSIVLWAVMMGVEPVARPYRIEHPHDVYDFGRCYRLLTLIPEWKPRLPELVGLSIGWRDTVHGWATWEAKYARAVEAGTIAP